MIAGSPVYGEAPLGKLRPTIIDEYDEAILVRVEITGSDGEGYIAKDALLAGGDCNSSAWEHKHAVFYDLKESLNKLNQTVPSPHSKIVQFYSSGESEIDLPEGATTIKVMKGSEYHIAEIEINIEGAVLSKAVQLSRWIDMPKQGWYSADGHLHIAGFYFPIHYVAQVAMGMPLFDNLYLEDAADEAARRKRWEFYFVAAPLRVPGGTGSPVNPLAIF